MSEPAQVSLQVGKIEREDFPVDVLIVGAGPAGLACAIELRRRFDAAGQSDKTVLVLEKAAEIGYHILSGAVMDPRGMAELFPDWKGNVIVGGLDGAHVERLVLDGEKVVAAEKLLVDLRERIRDVRSGPDGALWILTDSRNGKVLRITPGG